MPDDRTPHGGEVMHQPPDRAKIPEPEPAQPSADEASQDKSPSGGGKTDFVQTPD